MELEEICTPGEELEKLGVGRLRLAMVEGDVEMGSVMAGQVSAMVSGIQPAGLIIRDVISGAEKIITDIYNGKVNLQQ